MAHSDPAAKKAQEWFSSSRTLFEEYVAKTSSLSAQYLEALRKCVPETSRRQGVDELLHVTVEAATLLPRLAARHLANLRDAAASGQSSDLVLTTTPGTPVSGEFTIANSAKDTRSVTLTLSECKELPHDPSFASDALTVTPLSFDLDPETEQVVTVTFTPSAQYVPEKSYKCIVTCSGGLTGSLEVLLSTKP